MDLLQRTWEHRALAALAQIEGLHCGALSPLAQVARPAGAPQPQALRTALQGLEGDWRWLPAALVDPGMTLAVLVADRDSQRVGQYLWADRHAWTPGFRVELGADALAIHGPHSVEQLQLGLIGQLALGQVAEIPPARYELDAAMLWTLLALVDAHGTAAALRMAARVPGPPPGVAVGEIERAWQAGMQRPNPGWMVSLVAMLAPEALPQDFPGSLAASLAGLEEAGLLVLLKGEAGDPLGDVCLLGEGLDLLCQGLSAGGTGFGLLRSERCAEDRVEITRIAGWRTPGGIVLAELGGLAQDRAELLLTGPSYLVDLLDELLGGLDQDAAVEPAQPAELADHPLSVERLLRALPSTSAGERQAQAPACPRCGQPVSSQACFCRHCGAALLTTGGGP